MQRPVATRAWLKGAAIGAALMTLALHTSAQDIRIGPSTCGTGTRLEAHQARTSEVLRQLSTALDFSIKVEDPIDSVVNIAATQPTAELIGLLLASRNVIVTQGLDPKCPGKRRVTGVWVLGSSGNGLAARDRPGALPWVVSPEAKEQDEIYMRAHGMLPELPTSAPTR